MTIHRAEILGYCMGVRRAIEAAEQAVFDYPHKKVFTLGPLIHNNSALAVLESKGVKVLPEDGSVLPENPSQSVVIIRAHGVPPCITQKLKNLGCIVVDATCPRVLSSQKRAANYAQKGATVFLAGDKNHGEIVGISGYATSFGAKCIVLANSQDAEKIESVTSEAVLISQTTISRAEFDSIASILRRKIPHLTVCNTICSATQERQNALVELCSKVDGVLIIGGKHSANTRRLLRTAQEICPKSFLIETAQEIPNEFFELKRVGLTAGASTPDFVIDDVEEKLNAFAK